MYQRWAFLFHFRQLLLAILHVLIKKLDDFLNLLTQQAGNPLFSCFALLPFRQNHRSRVHMARVLSGHGNRGFRGFPSLDIVFHLQVAKPSTIFQDASFRDTMAVLTWRRTNLNIL